MKAAKRSGVYSALVSLMLVAIMCTASILSYLRIIQDSRANLIDDTHEKIHMVAVDTNLFLQMAESVVNSEAGTIEYMIQQGCTNADILDYLLYETDDVIGAVNGDFTGVYGYFRGEYLDGNRWDPYVETPQYNPRMRPWYTAARDQKGEVALASPYLDMDTGHMVLSVTRMLSDGESVVGMDVSLKSFSDYINSCLSEYGFSYAYIVDGNGTIVASRGDFNPGEELLPTDAETDVRDQLVMIQRALEDDEPFERTVEGKSYLVVSQTIGNGWQVIAAAEEDSVLSPLRRTIMTVTLLLVTLFGVLLYLSIRSIVNKKKQRQAERDVERYMGELKDSADQLSNYKRAVLSDALISLEANLSRDELYYGVWKDDLGNEVALKDIIGLTTPCSYDAYIQLWMRKFVKNDDMHETFYGSTDREYLLKAFREGKNEITFDYEAKTISGRSAWLRRSICMTYNRAGDVIAYTSVKDVSALIGQNKREEAYVRALSTEYDGIAVVSLNEDKNEDRVVLHSRLSETLAAMADEETLNEPNFAKVLQLIMRHIHPDDRDAFSRMTTREQILKGLAENKTYVVDFRFMRPDGESLYYQLRFVPLRDDDGEDIGLIACLRSIDGEIRREFGIRQELENARIAAESANRAKSVFLFNMSHDIRTPMNAILGFTEIALKHADDKKQVEESLSKVKMSGEHLLSLINDVLDMSRVESGSVTIDEEPVFIDMARDNLYNILAGSAAAKNILLNSVIDENVVHHWIYADRLRIMRVLTNIVSNSVKYTNPGGRIDILLEELPCDKEDFARIRYTVSDNGIGMSPEYLEHIFEPFSRAESATKSGVTGTGLGMAITKSLVELMNGTVCVESRQGEGTTVRIEIEHRIAEPIEPAPTEKAMDCVSLSGKKVLLVEDNELNREIAVDILEEQGVEVDTAEDGDVAVEKIGNAPQGRYDLVLMDIQMPRMNGYEATRAIRALPDKYASSIPIIAMTANAFEEDKRNAEEAGMNGHIAKPIDIPLLLTTLSNILK